MSRTCLQGQAPAHHLTVLEGRAGASRNVLRGRDAELELIAGQLDATLQGRGGVVVVVEGSPGIGKTALLTEAAAVARRNGVHAVYGGASDTQRTVPFAPLVAALLDGERALWQRTAIQQLMAKPDLQYWLIEELHSVLEAAALETPQMIVLDDLQWADGGTLAALRVLVSRFPGLPLLWVLALRPGEARAEVRGLVAALDAVRVELRPLQQDAVAAIVADRFQAAGTPALLALAASAHGNPFLLGELLAGLREERRILVSGASADVVGHALPARLAESMRERLEHLSDDARHALRLAAALGRRFTVDQLAALLDRRPSELMGCVEEILRADLVWEDGDRLCFRHDLLREAVLATLPATIRRGLLREAAAVLLEHGAQPVEVAAHLAGGAEYGDAVAIATLRAAADTTSASDVGMAAELALRALELSREDDPARGTLVAQTLVLLHAAMRDEDARGLAASALDGGHSVTQEAEVRLSLSGMFMRRSPVERAAENRRALALADLPDRLRIQHLAWLAHNLGNAGLVRDGAAVVGEALAAAREAGDLEAVAVATTGEACIEAQCGRFEHALERVDEVSRLIGTDDDHAAARVLEFHRADLLALSGRVGEAICVLRTSLARGRRERRAWLIEASIACGARVRLLGGRLADARADAEAAGAMLPEVAATSITGAWGMCTLFEVALHTGDARELAAITQLAARVAAVNNPAVRRYAVWVLAKAAELAGDASGAAAWLADDELPYAAPFLPGDPAYQPQVARIALAAGDGALARRAVEVADRFAAANPGLALVQAAALHTRGLVDADRALLVRAAELQRGSERPLPHASALEDAGRVLGRAGRGAEAVELLGDALETYSACGATADAARVAQRLRRHGVRRLPAVRARPSTGWESLTESELRVARLVGAGATNRDAAGCLYVSPHTVSTHLRHAFAKLGINSRVELARVVFEHEPTPHAPLAGLGA